jgi:hypothetical protein
MGNLILTLPITTMSLDFPVRCCLLLFVASADITITVCGDPTCHVSIYVWERVF